MPKIELFNEDCMALMARYPDKYFDLACVDPPYGIGMDGGKYGIDGCAAAQTYVQGDWDRSAPQKEYFSELERVSKNQIIWGANHFADRLVKAASPCWIVWDKEKIGGVFADSELAYTSFTTAVRNFKFQWHGMLQGNMAKKESRIHPTQKPVALYEWLLTHYAKPGQRILDTHLGSGSSAIAAYNLGFDFVGTELDADYYAAAVRRFEAHKAQGMLFQPDDYTRVERDAFEQGEMY